VFAADGKEMHFFDQHWDRGVDWYSQQFERAQPGQLTIEATPMYLSNPVAMTRISSVCPHAALIAILRHPIDRMHSHFYYRRARGLESGTIEDAVAREIACEADAFPYLGIGLYCQQLVRANSLGLERPVCVLWYDDLANDPKGVATQLAEFLGISPGLIKLDGRRVNAADQFRSVRLRRASKRWPASMQAALARVNRREVAYPPLDGATRGKALDYFHGDIAQLAQLTGRDLALWLE
jgi:hypothetical protein